MSLGFYMFICHISVLPRNSTQQLCCCLLHFIPLTMTLWGKGGRLNDKAMFIQPALWTRGNMSPSLLTPSSSLTTTPYFLYNWEEGNETRSPLHPLRMWLGENVMKVIVIRVAQEVTKRTGTKIKSIWPQCVCLILCYFSHYKSTSKQQHNRLTNSAAYWLECHTRVWETQLQILAPPWKLAEGSWPSYIISA